MPIVIEPAGSPAPRRLSLSRQEWDLLWTVRAVAPGALQDSLMRLLREVAAFVCEPGCAETQADGVPCDSASSDCEQCRRVTATLARLSESLRG